MNKFEHELGAEVTLTRSGKTGEIIGRAQYQSASNGYLIRYKAADGRQVENWWDIAAIKAT